MRVLFLKGGPGSGDHGHRGRPGKVGGSAPAENPPEAAARAVEVRRDAIAGATTGERREAARAYARRAFGGRDKPFTVNNVETGWTIIVSPAGVKHATSGAVTPIHAAVVSVLPELVEQARLVASAPDRAGRRDIVAVHTMAARLADDGQEVDVRLIVREMKGSKRFYYDHFVIEEVSPAAVIRDASTEVGALSPGTETGDALDVASDDPLAKALAPGERWITVHPHGPGSKGSPVLIQPQPDGSAKVVGGAGGKLNHLRITGVRSEADYAAEARNRDTDRREAKKLQGEQDKKAGLTASKKAARETLKAGLREHQARFVQQVADALGWTPDQLRFPAEKFANEPVSEQNRAARAHARELLKRARGAVKLQRENLIRDAERRAEGGLGEVPLTADRPDQLTVQDLDPVAPSTKGLGFSTNYRERAAAAGLTEDGLKEEAAAARPDGAKKPMGERIRDDLAAIREPMPAVDPGAIADARKAVDLLKAEKALRAAAADARTKGREIDGAKAPVEPKAYVIETTEGVSDQEVMKEIEDDLRTASTRGFLDRVGEAGGAASLGRHVGVGAYNSINAVALAAGGAALLDRSVVDVLGVAGASQVLARRLATDLTGDELGRVQEAMQAFHVDHYMAASDKALREARDWHEMASEIEVGSEARDGADLAVAQELNARRREFVGNAEQVLGTAYGEMEANAALVVALRRGKTDQVQVSLGSASIEDGIRQARALGLQRGEYTLQAAGASTLLTVTGAGMDRLAKPVAREDLAHVRGALDIIEGRADEDGWLPLGVADRPDLAMNVLPGTAERLAKPFPRQPADVEGAIRDFIGARTADGDTPADVMADLLNEDTLSRAGDRGAFMAAVDRIAPLYQDGKMVRAETHGAAFEAAADAYVGKLGGDRSPLHRQRFAVDRVAVDSLHRALAEHPEGVLAFKPVGDLTRQDQRALRAAFTREHGRVDAGAGDAQADLQRLDASEPEREVDDMFGRSTNPLWTEWQVDRNAAAEKVNKATMTWGKYVEVMGSPEAAYASMQDTVKSKVLGAFATAHNTARGDKPLRVGRTAIVHDLEHLDALDPGAREKRLADRRELADSLRNRAAGQYAKGSVSDKLEAARAADEAARQSQMGLFGASDDGPAAADEDDTRPPARPPALGERVTIGHAAERQVAGMMPIVGKQFSAGQGKTALWKPDMSGAYVGRQRAVKLIEHNKRTGLGLGVGSGKTSIMLSGFTQLQQQGKAKRGLFLVPSIVQGQFHGEALTLLEPGKFTWHCQPGASREERIAGYKNPDTHFSVVTHQAFRDDMLHLAGAREGVEPSAIAARLGAMSAPERKDYLAKVLEAEGIDHDYLAVDEGHNLLNRAGKEDSSLSHVVDGVSDSRPYYVNATADPVKNDPSEAFDVLRKMDPGRYTDRDAFMRRYGVDTAASRDGLQRELARHFYTGRIDPGVKVDRQEISVPLSDQQHSDIRALDGAAARARLARMKGGVDVDALRALSAGSFDGVDEAQHGAIASQLNKSIGILHSSAVKHAVDGGAKTEHLAGLADKRRGKPGVVFAHSRKRVAEIAERLKREGHRVVTLTGSDSTAEKDRKKKGFQGGEHDIIVMSDAGAVGANLQRGQWLAQYDTPDTAMVHAQRNGRIHRMGQKNDVELLDLVADHGAERRARRRLTDKYELRDITTSPLGGLDDHGIAGYLRRAGAEAAEAAEAAAAAHPGGGWREVGNDEVLPAGSHVRMDMATGRNHVAEPPAPEGPANDDHIDDDRQAAMF